VAQSSVTLILAAGATFLYDHWGNKFLLDLAQKLIQVCCVLYCAARMALEVLVFLELRKLPGGVYLTVN
jgi:hypothetical protein